MNTKVQVSDSRSVSSNLASWILVLSLVGYPLVAALTVYFHIPNRFLSVPFRGLILILSMVVIMSFIIRKNHYKITIFWMCWWLFWLVYVFRIFFDFVFNPDALQLPVWEYFVYAVGVSFIPALALGIMTKIDAALGNKVLVLTVILGAVAIVVTLWIFYVQTGFSAYGDLATTRVETETLNPISLGQLSVTVIILSLWLLLVDGKLRIRRMLFVAVPIVIAGIGLIASGSRGPALSLVMVFPFLMVALGMRNIILYFFGGVFLVFIVVSGGAFIFDSYFMERILSSAFTDPARIQLMIDAYNIFVNNPILGGGIQPMESYPHNVLLESFMACGIVGGVFFVYIMFYALFVSLKLRSSCNFWISLLFVQYAVAGMVSGSIYFVSTFWALTALVVGQFANQSRSHRANYEFR